MVNQVIGRRLAKGQQMRWTAAAPTCSLQVRLAVQEGGLQHVFRRLYPRFAPAALAAA